MAHAPGEGYVDRYSELAKVLTGARGGEPIHELSPELLLAAVVEDDRYEFHAPAGSRLWTFTQTQISDATHFAQIEILNPAASGMLVVVMGCRAFQTGAAAAAGLIIAIVLDGTVSGGGTIKPILLDTRLSGSTSAIGSSGKPDLAVGAQQVLDQQLTRSVQDNVLFAPTDGKPLAILFPSHRVKVELAFASATVSLNASMWGYERQLAPGEDKVR